MKFVLIAVFVVIVVSFFFLGRDSMVEGEGARSAPSPAGGGGGDDDGGMRVRHM